MLLKSIISGLCLVFLAPAAFAQNKGKSIDVYLIGGQSNATGQGYIRNMADSMKIDTSVMIFHSGKPHLNSGKPPLTWAPVHQASESPDRFGPELGFAFEMRQLYPTKAIAIIKHAHSGTNLYVQWNPGKDQADSLHWGEQFKAFVETVNLGLESLRKMGYTPKIKGMIWHQGESDAHPKDGASSKYAANFTHFIKRIRLQFNSPNMPFIYGYILQQPTGNLDLDLVRKAQQDIDGNSGSKIALKYATVVYTDDLSRRANDRGTAYPKDYIHLGTKGTWILGLRMASAFKKFYR